MCGRSQQTNKQPTAFGSFLWRLGNEKLFTIAFSHRFLFLILFGEIFSSSSQITTTNGTACPYNSRLKASFDTLIEIETSFMPLHLIFVEEKTREISVSTSIISVKFLSQRGATSGKGKRRVFDLPEPLDILFIRNDGTAFSNNQDIFLLLWHFAFSGKSLLFIEST